MCSGGKPISAGEAAAVGLVDRLIEGDLLSGAAAFAREIVAKPAPKTRERAEKLGTAAENATIFAAARAAVSKKQRGLKAPNAAIAAVEAATKLPFEEGCQAEAKLFTDCLFSDQSKALIHVFFGEREVAKIPDVPKETPVIPVNRVAVVGSGTMGGGIAMVFANAGIPVLLKDVDEAALDAGMTRIRKNYASSVQRGRFTQAFVDERLQLITPVLNYEAFSRVDMVVEAVFEGMALKKTVFADIDRVCRRGAILATNTSTLNIDEIASVNIPARSGDRDALFQSGQYHAPARNCARGKVEQRSDCHLHAAIQEAGQDRGVGRKLPRFRWQPHVRPLSPRSAVPG